MTTQAIAKLPKWVQDHIRMLEMRLAESRHTIETMLPTAESNTTWQDGMDVKPLPNNSVIRFSLGPSPVDDKIIVRIDTDRGDLYIQGGRMLQLMPEATNTVRVKLRPWEVPVNDRQLVAVNSHEALLELLRRAAPYIKTVSRNDNWGYEQNDQTLYEEMCSAIALAETKEAQP